MVNKSLKKYSDGTGDFSEIIDRRKRKNFWFEITAALIFYIVLLIGLSLILINEKNKFKTEAIKLLENSIEISEQMIENNWMANKLREANVVAKNTAFVKNAVNILELHKNGKDIFKSAPLKSLNEFIRKEAVDKEYLEFYLISPDSINVFSTEKEKLGRKSDLWKKFPIRMHDAFDGEPQFSSIIVKDSVFNEKIGVTGGIYPTMFILMPVKDQNFNIAAVMAVRFSPLNDFNAIVQMARISSTEETYLVSDNGTLLTQARNLKTLREKGILKPDEFSFGKIELRDPGVNLLEREVSKIPGDKQKFTLSAQEIINHKSGFSKKSYRNYYGEKVYGAWRWNDRLNVGFCAEIRKSEVLGSYKKFRYLIYFLFFFIVALTIIFIFALKRRYKKERERILESENYYSEVLNRASSGIITCDEKGKIRTFNLEAEKIFGYDKCETIGKDFSSLFDPSCASRFADKDFQEAIKEHSKEKDAVKGKKKNGKTFPLKLTLSENFLNGKKIFIAIIEDLTEIVETKSALKKSINLYKKTYSGAPIGIANVNENGKFISANEYLLNLLGYTEQELLSKAIYDIFKPENASEIKAKFNAVLSGKEKQVISKIPTEKKSGDIILSSVSCSRIFDDEVDEKEFILILEDITEKDKYEEQLKERAEELEESNRALEKAKMAALSIMQDANLQKLKVEKTIAELEKSNLELRKIYRAIEQLSVSVVITNRDGSIEYVNPFFTKTTGYTFNEAIGQNPKILNSGTQSKEFYEDMWKTLTEQKVWIGEFLNRRKNGELYWEKATISPLVNEKGEITHYVAVKEDITEKKKYDLELKKAKLAAEAATEAKSRFLASMSHEIRTPMNAIIGLTHLALQAKPSPKLTDYLSKIGNSSALLLNIINDILDFSKIEAGEMSVEKVEFNLEEVIKSTVNLISQKAYEKGLEVILNMPPETPINLIGDPLRIGQVLTNYANNAVKFTNEGEIVISVETVKETETSVEMLFSVKDTGIGIKEEHKSKLFNAFQQADISTTRKFGGTGLGLAISQKLVQLMGGKTWFESRENIGSVFYVRLPFEKQDAARKDRVRLLNALEKKEVLFCDSNRKIRDYVKKILISFGMKAHLAESCNEILKKENENLLKKLDLVIIDYKNIKSEGSDILNRITDKLKENLPVVITASLADMELIEKFEDEMENAEILLKPVLPSDLYNKIIPFFSENKKLVVTDFKKQNRETALEKIKGALILLTEDNEINQQIASEILSSVGMRVDIAENGLEAVAMVKNSGVPSAYSLVLMDIQMPYMDGFTATKEIRKLSDYEDLPIVAMTADAMQGVEEKCFAAGMVDYLTKPIDFEKLIETLLKWINPKSEKFVEKSIDASITQPLAEIKSPDADLPEIDGIDVNEGLRLVGNNKKLFVNLLVKFEKNYSEFEKEIRTYWDSGDNETVLRMVHTLKGNAGSLGMKRLFSAVSDAHSLLLKENALTFDEIFSEIFEELNPIIKALKEWKRNFTADEKKDETGAGSAKPLEEVAEKLERLSELLKVHDSDAVSLVSDIGIIEGYETESEELIESVRGYRFEQAIEILLKIN